MIIQDALLRGDGTVEVVDIEVSDNYFEPSPTPPIDDITALQLALAELAEAQTAGQTANELALAELAELMIGG